MIKDVFKFRKLQNGGFLSKLALFKLLPPSKWCLSWLALVNLNGGEDKLFK